MNPFAKLLIGATLGGILGYLYYYLIGCNMGSCPITSNPYLSIFFGILMGLLLFSPSKKDKSSDKQRN